MCKLTLTESGENKKFNYDARLERLLKLTNENLLITKNENIFYLTGFKGTAGWLLISGGKKYLFVDSRYCEHASKVTHKTTVILVASTYYDALAEFCKEKNIKEIYAAKNGLYLSDYENIVSSMVNNSIKIGISKADVDTIRYIKEKEEIKIMKDNLNRAERAMTKMLSFVKEGVTEKELAAELEYQMRKEGGDKTAFDTILLFGERTSLPHGVPSDRKLKLGDNILMDFGLSKDGYKSDITRTYFFGKGNNFEEMSKIYNIVKEAHHKGIEAIHSNVSGKEADNAAREVIKNNGYGQYFGHGLGHSLGLEIHEDPRLSPLVDHVLEGGCIVTVEPGIYVPNLGGVRIENMVIVTKEGGVSMNDTPTDLIVL